MENLSKQNCGDCGDDLLADGAVPYFSCILCIKTSSYSLCSPCYHKAEIKHHHPSINFLDHRHNLLKLSTSRTADGEKKEMDEIRCIALAYYQAGSEELQSLAHAFFKSMDTDGNGSVEKHEFLSFMSKDDGLVEMKNSKFFAEMDQDGSGALDFWEVLTMYYITKSGRPFCEWCGKFILGTFFSCVQCFSSSSSFCVCCDCYLSTTSDHEHDGISQFADNYSLLVEAQKQLGCPQSKGKIAFEAIEKSLTIASIATGACNVVATAAPILCTIM